MNYIIKRKEGNLHFYFKKNIGIIVCEENGLQDVIYKNCSDKFCVYQNEDGIHIICVSDKRMLVYILLTDGDKKEYELCEIKDGFDIKRIAVVMSNERMNLLYSGEYEGDILLVHCVLGNNALPSVIDKLKNEYFFAAGDNVYYTNKNGTLGYQDLSDGKPDRFVRVADSADDAYVYSDDGRQYLLYRRHNTIYLNHSPIIEDDGAKFPIILNHNNELVVMWLNEGVVKCTNVNKKSPIKKFLSTGERNIYSVQQNKYIFYDYTYGGLSGEEKDSGNAIVSEDVVNMLFKIKDEINLLEEQIKKQIKTL